MSMLIHIVDKAKDTGGSLQQRMCRQQGIDRLPPAPVQHEAEHEAEKRSNGELHCLHQRMQPAHRRAAVLQLHTCPFTEDGQCDQPEKILKHALFPAGQRDAPIDEKLHNHQR